MKTESKGTVSIYTLIKDIFKINTRKNQFSTLKATFMKMFAYFLLLYALLNKLLHNKLKQIKIFGQRIR